MILAVGGHSRNIGKTSVVAGLIAATKEARWTAVKITQHGHGVCSEAGEPCDCAIEYDHPFAVSQEIAPGPTDSGRFLGAGAERSFWLRTAQGQLGFAMPELRRILESSVNAILESNSVMGFLRPDLYLVVLDPRNPDMKESARLHMNRADAFVLTAAGPVPWTGIPPRWIEARPCFDVTPPGYVSPELAAFVAARLPAHR